MAKQNKLPFDKPLAFNFNEEVLTYANANNQVLDEKNTDSIVLSLYSSHYNLTLH